MFRLLGILTVGNLLFGGGHHRRSLRRGLLFGALLGYLANKDFDMDRVQKEARDAARKARKTAHKAARAVREEIRNARKAAHDRQVAGHMDRIRAEAEARKAEREARRAEKDTEKAETTNQFPALPQSGTREAQVIQELADDLERNVWSAAAAANIPTIDFPEEDEKYHASRKHGYA